MTTSVLLVGDNPNFLRILGQFLSEHGKGDVRVLGAVAAGRDALAEAKRLRPEVILVDLKMWGVSGEELLSQLRATLPDTVLIALSLMDPDEFRADIAAAGADAFVSKMSLERDLLPAIHRVPSRRLRRGTTLREG